TQVPTDPAARERSAGKLRTVLPSRRDVACCHCGEETFILGQAHFSMCPKCHKRFDVVDYTLGTTCAPVIRTGGAVRISPEGTLIGGDIQAAFIILDGAFSGGRMEAFRSMEFRPGARVNDFSKLFFRDLIIAEGTDLSFQSPLVCRTLDVGGRLQADVTATGRVSVRSGAMLQGRVKTPSLRVEDGGGLIGSMVIGSMENAS
ncbi:MAG: polymer-forming cytoskeletal protein, partial [Kiritimatiellia bacterium]|nr:polymer-forming cytoskeletal protein [Kiritimatiellia bacterium]